MPALLPSPFIHVAGDAPFTSETFASYGSTLSDTDFLDCDPPAPAERDIPDPGVFPDPDPGVSPEPGKLLPD